MLRKVLIANRGEIALRVWRACRDLGIAAVVAYSEADQDSLVVRLADQSICIGPPTLQLSYLNPVALISAATITGCDAIHPGYGFLAENADFAATCARHNLTFVGPHPQAIRQMGNKAAARQVMHAAGVPIVPGSEGELGTIDQARATARDLGYPVMLKPTVGGGGRSMRVVFDEEELTRSFPTVRAEAESAFGQSNLILEKFFSHVRHIEIQVLADQHGNAIWLGERDCSVQRRHQKIVEEAPAPLLSPALREQLGAAALRGLQTLGYNNAGTVEFLLDQAGNFWFIEMNARIQVEHPVTEMVTGIDLVKWQLLLAGGEPLTLRQDDITLRGHAIECRINAEDPARDFLPELSDIHLFVPPGGPGVRVDSHIYSGYAPSRLYDALLAKIIAWGQTRHEALNRMQRALHECIIEGPATTIPFQRAMLDDPAFRAGDISTRYVAEMMDRWRNAA